MIISKHYKLNVKKFVSNIFYSALTILLFWFVCSYVNITTNNLYSVEPANWNLIKIIFASL